VLRINPTTGVASVVGPSNGLFGAGYGMAVTLSSTQNLSPASFSVLIGTLQGGSLAQLLSSDNGYVVILESPFRSRRDPAVRMEVVATSPSATLSQLKFRLESKTNAVPAGDVGQRIELFNSTTNDWELIDSRGSTSSDSVAEPTVSGNPSRFVHPTTRQMRARLSWFDAPNLATRGWTVSIDETTWILQL
jgi:hypothetical protein